MRNPVIIIIMLVIVQLTELSAQTVYSRSEFNSTYLSGGTIHNTPMNSVRLDSLIRSVMYEYRIIGYSGCVIKEGELFWRGSYGYSYLDDSIPLTDSTLFRLAALSNLFGATAVMQLEEDGLIDLDADVNDYLGEDIVINPHFPEDSITVKMILTHTSSIHDNWTHWDEMSRTGVGDHPVPLDSGLIAYLKEGGAWYDDNNYIDAEPGSTFEFSDIGISMLAYIVECVTDTSFEGYCQKNIFKPLGMNNTSWFYGNLDSMDITHGYGWFGNEYKQNGYWGFVFYPCNHLKSSSAQLTNFLLAYMNRGIFGEDTLLKAETIDRMLTREVYDEDFDDYFGLTWYETTNHDRDASWNEDRLWGHHGLSGGYLTGLYFSPEENWGIISLSNTYSNTWDNSRKGENIIVTGLSELASGKNYFPSGVIQNSVQRSPSINNYPNPFSQVTTIEFTLPEPGFTTLNIYNLFGRHVETIVSDDVTVGTHKYEWDAENLTGGMYLYRLETSDYVQTGKMLLNR